MGLLTRTEIAQYENLADTEWRAAGIGEDFVKLSKKNGMDAEDIQTFVEFTRSKPLMVILRNPPVATRALHRIVGRAKPMAVKIKAHADGIVRTDKGEYTSDYDLMSVWRLDRGLTPQRLRVSPQDNPVPKSEKDLWRGAFSPEAREFVRELNGRLVARLQHGCQDDWPSPHNRGVKVSDHFTAFLRGGYKYLEGPVQCQRFYFDNKLQWPYLRNGKFDFTGSQMSMEGKIQQTLWATKIKLK